MGSLTYNRSCLPYFLVLCYYVSVNLIGVLVYKLFMSTLYSLKHICESGCRVHVYYLKLEN